MPAVHRGGGAWAGTAPARVVGSGGFLGARAAHRAPGGRSRTATTACTSACSSRSRPRRPCGGCCGRRRSVSRCATVGANPDAARYAGIDVTRTLLVTMAISGALAGIAGTIEVLGVSTCRCLPLFFSSGYGFESVAIALLARNNPLGIVLGSFVFGAMRNGADFMELHSGVSKDVVSLIQGLVLLFVAAPALVRRSCRAGSNARDPAELSLVRATAATGCRRATTRGGLTR